MWYEAKWITVPTEEIRKKQIFHGDMTGRFAYFRCDVQLPAKGKLQAQITASSRYRLWVNEKPVLSGPCKGDSFRQYYETVDLSDYLQVGHNCFCVQVLYCDPSTAQRQTDPRAAIYGVMGPAAGHHFAMEGKIFAENGETLTDLTTGKADWRVWLDNTFYLTSTETTQFLGAVEETIDFTQTLPNWKTMGFSCQQWQKASCADTVAPTDPLYAAGVLPRFRIKERPIPLLYEKEDRFVRDFSSSDGGDTGLLREGSITVAPNTEQEIIVDAQAVKNGYPAFSFCGGSGAAVTITYFEKFGGNGSNLKRTDYINGAISGLTDTVRLCGGQVRYEPFWVRTFRFICIRVKTGEEALTVFAPTFRHTGYPLRSQTEVSSCTPWVGQLWDICLRTLENCMLETYMDCPYYEQLQFAMDTRLEALYTYIVTDDHALARKALIDFHYGMQPEGLTAGKYPSAYLQILSTFSLHYIMMLWEYFRKTEDTETLRLCRGDVDRILDYYDAHIGNDGLVGNLEFWQFVDWHPDWNATAGMPAALTKGPSTIINLMYAYTLSCTENLASRMGRNGLAQEYALRRSNLLQQVQKLCYDQALGLYREGPEFDQFTRHAQSWAVVNDLHPDPKGLLTRTLAKEDCLKCSFSTAFEWFQALEKAGMYDAIRQELESWIGLLALDCTTCPETPQDARSDCHAWSALPMYTLIRTVAGFQEMEARESCIRIHPHLMDLTDLKGKVITNKGIVDFSYHLAENGKWHYEFTFPEGLSAELTLPNGRMRHLEGSHITIDTEVLP